MSKTVFNLTIALSVLSLPGLGLAHEHDQAHPGPVEAIAVGMAWNGSDSHANSSSLSTAAHNAVQSQQNSAVTMQGATTQGVMPLEE